MKICLLNLQLDPVALGPRYLSSYLKKNGHETSIINLLKDYTEYETSQELCAMVSLLQEISPDVVGVSLMSDHFTRAVAITQRIRRLGLPIIWGGVHPSIVPLECLQFADMVCLGEGEEALLDLMNKMEGNENVLETKSIWFNRNGKIIKNEIRHQMTDLDMLPFPDYDFENEYIVLKGNTLRMTHRLLRECRPRGQQEVYKILDGRGCAMHCTYCLTPNLRQLSGGGKPIRRRSVGNIIEELVWVKNSFDDVMRIGFLSEDFMAASVRRIEAFSREYMTKVGLSFYCFTTPMSVSRDRTKLLASAGLDCTPIGLQTGSENIRRNVYGRLESNERFLQAAKILDEFNVYKNVDIIMDCPYECEEDLVETIRMLTEIKKPYKLQLYGLQLFPGTDLYKRALRDGLISKDYKPQDNTTRHFKSTYLNRLIEIAPKAPKKLVLFLATYRDNKFCRALFWLFWNLVILQSRTWILLSDPRKFLLLAYRWAKRRCL